MLDIPGTCVALDSEEAEEVKAKNEKYQEVMCEQYSRINNIKLLSYDLVNYISVEIKF